VAGWTIASASRAVNNPRNRPTNINRSMLPKRSLFGAVRRRTLICWRSAKFSATRATLNRKSPMNAHQINLQRSHIGRQHPMSSQQHRGPVVRCPGEAATDRAGNGRIVPRAGMAPTGQSASLVPPIAAGIAAVPKSSGVCQERSNLHSHRKATRTLPAATVGPSVAWEPVLRVVGWMVRQE
jgi:hypothetical protein